MPSAATILSTALQMVRQALSRADSHPQRAIDGLRELEKYLDSCADEFTPIQGAVASRALRESSSSFRAADVTQHLEQGKAAVARIDGKRKSIRPRAPR